MNAIHAPPHRAAACSSRLFETTSRPLDLCERLAATEQAFQGLDPTVSVTMSKLGDKTSCLPRTGLGYDEVCRSCRPYVKRDGGTSLTGVAQAEGLRRQGRPLHVHSV
jgi:hypothetical protein